MGNTVLITEKPSVAREYAKVLGISQSGDGYIEGRSRIDGKYYYVTWAVGHLVTMAYPDAYDQSLKKWSLDTLPFIPENYIYETISNVKKQFSVIKKLYNSKDTSEIYYAGDSGREGIYIQVLIRQEAKVRSGITEKVVWIDSQTESEILRGIREAKPLSAYRNLIDSAYMRAIEDYLVGINFSRALSCKFGYQFNKEIGSDKYKPLAVGRVMTCVLGMIVKREREIKDFKETLFYKPVASTDKFDAKWKAIEETPHFNQPYLYKNEGFLDRDKADSFSASLNSVPYLTVEEVEAKNESKKAPNLYNLAEIQNDCTKLFKISPEETLSVIQSLYEAKLVTYPRTDARVLSSAVAKEIKTNLEGLKNGRYLTDKITHILSTKAFEGLEKTSYVDDSKITDHYAIIPTGDVSNENSLNELQENIYKLIVRRFLSIFYPAATYKKINVVLKHSQNEYFFASEKTLINPGYLEIAGKNEDDNTDLKLGNITKGERMNANFTVAEGKTNPPKRYTSGSMILAMENAGNLIENEELRSQIKSQGIGTSATRAGIISKLVDNGYIRLEKKTQTLSPVLAGEKLYDIVDKYLPSLLSPEMTASWEKGLSQIESGTVSKDRYSAKLTDYICSKVAEIKEVAAQSNPSFVSEDTGIRCPYCGGKVITTANGYKCEHYSKDDGCSFYFGKISGREFTIEEINNILETGSSPLINDFTSKKGTKYSAFVTFDRDNKEFKLKFPENIQSEHACPECGNLLVKNRWSLDCDCGFKMSTSIAHKDLSDKEINELITNGETKSEVKGLKKKDGKSFNAKIKRDNTGQISFIFAKR